MSIHIPINILKMLVLLQEITSVVKCTDREKLAPNVHLVHLVPDRILVFAVRLEDIPSGPLIGPVIYRSSCRFVALLNM